MDAQIVTTPDTRKGLTMSAASWPRDRREAACAAADHPATATSTALIDGVAYRAPGQHARSRDHFGLALLRQLAAD
jgi:hypothetical protein